MATATPAEIRAEAERRTAARQRGERISPVSVELPAVRGGKTERAAVAAATLEAAGVYVVKVTREAERLTFDDPRKRQVRLPWSSLEPDNAKYAPTSRAGKPVIILTKEYRAAKAKARIAIIKQLDGRAPIEGPCALRAFFYEPNRSSRRDIANYTKLVHDALTGLVYVDDSQLDDVRWIRSGVDIDAPRVEIVVEALT